MRYEEEYQKLIIGKLKDWLKQESNKDIAAGIKRLIWIKELRLAQKRRQLNV